MKKTVRWERVFMTTYNNFDSFNGRVLPSTGRHVSFGIEECYIDENGDLWMPCECGAAQQGQFEDNPSQG